MLNTEKIYEATLRDSFVEFNSLYLYAPNYHLGPITRIHRYLGFTGDWSFYAYGCYKHLNGFGVGGSGHGFDLEYFNEVTAGAIHIEPSDCLPLLLELKGRGSLLEKYGIPHS